MVANTVRPKKNVPILFPHKDETTDTFKLRFMSLQLDIWEICLWKSGTDVIIIAAATVVFVIFNFSVI